MLYRLLRPLLFQLEPERAHNLAIAALQMWPGHKLGVGHKTNQSGVLATTVAGIDFPNPVGLAAGFDKDAKVADAILSMGFGFAEVGTITPLPQSGNPHPRLFRLSRDQAIINRMGFNNGGASDAAERLQNRHRRGGVVGINIGANKDAADRIADYATMTKIMAPLASYLVLNISSPNTPGLRALQDESALTALLSAVQDARGAVSVPIFLKVAPDLATADIDAISRIVMDYRLDALIVSNTTITRPPLLSRDAGEQGGLSGAPLKDLAIERLRNFRRATGGGIPLIGVGGIASAHDVMERICAGASLVQLYSAMIYHGPSIARQITRDLAALLQRDGFSNVAEAVGSKPS